MYLLMRGARKGTELMMIYERVHTVSPLYMQLTRRFLKTSSVRTPMLNSMVPQRTSIVEFPSPYAVTRICKSRRMEQSVVKRPRRNKPQSTPFFQIFIWSLSRIGIGRAMTTTSHAIVKSANA
jgi:hypothetical protein